MLWHEEDAILSKDYPFLLNRDGTPYDFTNDVGEGWESLCIRTFEKIFEAYARHADDSSRFALVQIKEKFGGLRIYLGGMETGLFEDVNDIVENAESESFTICEKCGKPGKPREGGWIKTLCDDCATERT